MLAGSGREHPNSLKYLVTKMELYTTLIGNSNDDLCHVGFVCELKSSVIMKANDVG